MKQDQLESIINAAWDDRANLGFDTRGEVRVAVDSALAMLDAGTARYHLSGQAEHSRVALAVWRYRFSFW